MCNFYPDENNVLIYGMSRMFEEFGFETLTRPKPAFILRLGLVFCLAYLANRSNSVFVAH